MNNLIMDISKDIMKDFIIYIEVANFYVSPDPLLLNFTFTVDVNNVKDQDCLFQKGQPSLHSLIVVVVGVIRIVTGISDVFLGIFKVRKDLTVVVIQRIGILELASLPISYFSATCE